MSRPSPALVVAVLALVVAAAGGGYAAGGLVTSAKIKNGTIKEADLSPTLKAKLRVKTGPPGPQGLAGAAGPSGISAREVVSATASFPISAVASCPPGKRLIGGGGEAQGSGSPTLRSSLPSEPLNAWIVREVPAPGVQAVAYAICAVVN